MGRGMRNSPGWRVILLVLLSWETFVRGASHTDEKCPPKCAEANTAMLGEPCHDVNYTVTLGATPGMASTLPAVSNFQRNLATRINSSAVVTCQPPGWFSIASSPKIVCQVNDNTTSINSSTYQILDMARLAKRGELEIGANFRITTFDYTFHVKEVPPQAKAPLYAFAVVMGIFTVVLLPFFTFKALFDDSFEVVSKRDKQRKQMLINKDRKERAKAAKVKARRG